MENPSCKSCVFFKPEAFDEFSGHCRRNPPAVFTTQYQERDRAPDDRTTTSFSSFVSVRSGDLCGEYDPRERSGWLPCLQLLGVVYYLLALAGFGTTGMYLLLGKLGDAWSVLAASLVCLLLADRYSSKKGKA